MTRNILSAIICILAVNLSPTTHAQGQRQLNYTPTQDGYISSHNGKNLYTRALYGGETLWRLETSDMPIFAAYHKTENRNINFTVTTKLGTVRLDSVAECTSLYRGGERIYKLSDPKWDKGSMTITVVACHDGESAIWQIKPVNMPKGATITASTCATVNVKLNRSGDMGADPANCFAPDPQRRDLKDCTVGLAGKGIVKYIKYSDRSLTADLQHDLEEQFNKAQNDRNATTSKLRINTPDLYINTLAPSLTAAADGIWDGTSYLHGAIGWRQPLSGWRGAYTGDFLGWHDRARSHFDAYAASQVTNVEPTSPHPTQDQGMNLARAEKRWGTQMYSNGYICRNPNRNDQMHHYDMNLCYIDQLLWHMKWTGDKEYARKMWPTIKLALEWEKRNYDPDNDGLYDAYCCIWASDALFYNSGAVTHSTAYNYRANKIAAEIAELIGEDPAPYRAESEKILTALNSTLWLDDKGVWAEYKDMMGNKLVHDHPGLWTIYHAIDSDVADAQQAYSATRYIIDNIPHIPVQANGLDANDYAVVSTTDWMPYAWSINNVAFAEMYHTALAMWQARRNDEAYKLLKSAVLDGMFLGNSPGNIGQISHYDAARGECYRDFADPVGVLARALVQGLFGFSPDAINNKATIRPGWPSNWQFATIEHADFNIDFKRDNAIDHYKVTINNPSLTTVDLQITPMRDSVKYLRINGEDAKWTIDTMGVGRPLILVSAPAKEPITLDIEWDGKYLTKATQVNPQNDEAYRQVSQGMFKWLSETKRPTVVATTDYAVKPITNAAGQYTTVDMSKVYNANVTDIFTNKYMTPRSPYTTLQIPVQGIGEWCHPKDSANIDDTALRNSGGTVKMPSGIPFATPAEGPNIAYATLWDNYPDHVTVPLSGKGAGVNLLLAGSTNHMQGYVPNATIDIEYADGTTKRTELIPPYNWCPIEQAYFTDGKAFNIATERPYRFALKDGIFSQDLTAELGLSGVDGQRIDGGAGVVLAIAVDPNKELKALRLTSVANDVVIGILAVTVSH